MSEVIINPLCLLGISVYHEKNTNKFDSGLASYGIIYAQQDELYYKVCNSAPLGTHKDTAGEIVNRLIEYESLRLKKAKTTVNYYDEFILVGWYCMGSEKALKNQAYHDELWKAFTERGAPFGLLIDATNKAEPILLRDKEKCKYSASMDPHEKFCVDTMTFQDQKSLSILTNSLKKQERLIDIYQHKLQLLARQLETTQSMEKKRKIRELLDMYDRIQEHNKPNKAKITEAINYAVLNGLILSNKNLEA